MNSTVFTASSVCSRLERKVKICDAAAASASAFENGVPSTIFVGGGVSFNFNMWAAAAAMASALPKGVSGSVEMRLGASFVSAEDERWVEIVELDLGLPLLLSAEAERLGRGVVFLVFTGVFLSC